MRLAREQSLGLENPLARMDPSPRNIMEVEPVTLILHQLLPPLTLTRPWPAASAHPDLPPPSPKRFLGFKKYVVRLGIAARWVK
jgi:hypothetical protein